MRLGVPKPAMHHYLHLLVNLFRTARIYILTLAVALAAMASADVSRRPQSDENYGYGRTATAVDLGLSVMWADHNVGADNAREPGRFFGYGDVEGSETSNDPRKYESGDISGTENDPAYVYWGSGWRMPTEKEIYELCDRCRWDWVRVGGTEGFRVTGHNGGSIFLPVTGMRSNGNPQFEGVRGYYWGGEVSDLGKDYAPALFFYKGGKLVKDYKKAYGFAIRPVYEGY